MKINGLTLVEGRSFEKVIESLNAEGFDHEVISEPHPTKFYFSDSTIGVKAPTVSSLPKWVGEGRYSCRGDGPQTWFHYGRHEIGPEFDGSCLNGNPRYDNGRLVERVRICHLRKVFES